MTSTISFWRGWSYVFREVFKRTELAWGPIFLTKHNISWCNLSFFVSLELLHQLILVSKSGSGRIFLWCTLFRRYKKLTSTLENHWLYCSASWKHEPALAREPISLRRMTTKRLISAVFCILLLSSVFVFSEAYVSNRVGKRGAKVNIYFWLLCKHANSS